MSARLALGAAGALAGLAALGSRRGSGSRSEPPWAPYTRKWGWGVGGRVPVGSRISLDELFDYWARMTRINGPEDEILYFPLFEDKPTWELRMVDPWVIESYSEPGKIQDEDGLDEESFAVEYKEMGVETAPPIVLFRYEGDDPRYAFLTSDGTHRARAALLSDRWIQAWVPADAPMRGSTLEAR